MSDTNPPDVMWRNLNFKGPIPTFDVNEFQIGTGPSGRQTSPLKTVDVQQLAITKAKLERRQRQSQREREKTRDGTFFKNTLTVLTVTRKGVAAVDVASMVGVVLSEELPGMLRRRPVLSGGDSEKQREIFKS